MHSLAGHVNSYFCLFAAFITADPKGKWVVCGSEDNNIFIWDLNKKEVSKMLFTGKLKLLQRDLVALMPKQASCTCKSFWTQVTVL